MRGVKDQESPNAPLSSSYDPPSGYREPDSLKFPSTNGLRIRSSTRESKRKRQSREERRMVDREYDIVLVPSDGGCLSGSESEDSDWSVGWLESHGSGFDGDAENSFAVLVPCYGRGRSERVDKVKSDVLGAAHQPKVFSSGKEDYIEWWLSSL
ncbi:uncharacterized protein A4U43_C01F6050 [Asparagus officinalis]|uniref:Uncharacterized protein n=1 Tax=Asparagus officinalis TaxID=4686 RepID=A0A5P1FMF1_ASPOF|nr:uncharacterized protein LOC109849656 [Asparagus officinalis]ONK79408.1 uncharacterized protein A4U43_C01F6050 [Asparagus officinalis]